MTHAETFALSEWLTEYPDNLSYAEIMEMLLTEDEQVTVWWVVERYNADDVWEFIEDTRRSFESTIEHMKTEGELA
jgi:hypothetical protein